MQVYYIDVIKLKFIVVLITGLTVLVAGSAFAYYHFSLPKKDKKVVAALKLTPTPTITPTPTSSPSATPTPIVKYIYYPTATPAPDIKQVLNEYTACKQACPIVDEGTTCTENSDNNDQSPVCETIESSGGKTTVNCKMGGGHTTCKSNKHPEESCISSCKSKYGLNF